MNDEIQRREFLGQENPKSEIKKQITKKVFVLFMSHNSGEHGLTIHNAIEEVKEAVKSVVESIKENSGKEEREINEAYNQDLSIVESINGDGFYSELSDTTWFDVFEREINI
jgi:hypothetical protein